MKAIKTYIILISVIIISFCNSATTIADPLSFDSILDKAIENSYDIKISDIDIGISKAELKSARSEYYPNLSVGYETEYTNGLRNDINQVRAVGTTFINQNTQFQNLIAIKLNYNLLDFGIRGQKTKIAKKDVDLKEILLKKNIRDLKLKIAALYTDALLNYVEIKSKESVLPYYNELFESKERLFKAGTTSKVGIMDEAVKIARANTTIEDSKTKLNDAMHDISSYTQDNYDIAQINMLNFDQEIPSPTLSPAGVPLFKQRIEARRYSLVNPDKQNFLEFRSYQLEIEKKRHELAVLKRQRLPTFSFYTNLIFYGTDPSNPLTSVGDINTRNLSVGISAMLPVFDGFKNIADRQKAQLEIQRLEIEQSKNVHEVMSQYNKLLDQYNSYRKELDVKENLLIKSSEQLEALERLIKSQVVDKIELLNFKTETINDITEIEKLKIKVYSTLKQLEILSEDY